MTKTALEKLLDVENGSKTATWKILYATLVFLYGIGVTTKEQQEEVPFFPVVQKVSLARSLYHETTTESGDKTMAPMYQPEQEPFNVRDLLDAKLVASLGAGDETNAGIKILNVLNCPQKSSFLQGCSYTLRWYAALSHLLCGVQFFIVDLRRYCLPAEKKEDEEQQSSGSGGAFCHAICNTLCKKVCDGDDDHDASVGGGAGPVGERLAAATALAILKALQAGDVNDRANFENLPFFVLATSEKHLANERLQEYEARVIKTDVAQRCWHWQMSDYAAVNACGKFPKQFVTPADLVPAPVTAHGDADEQRRTLLASHATFGRVDLRHIFPSSVGPLTLNHTCHPCAPASQQDLDLLTYLLWAHVQQFHDLLRVTTALPTEADCATVLQKLYFPLMLANRCMPAIQDPKAEVLRLWGQRFSRERFGGGSAHAASTRARTSSSHMHFALPPAPGVEFDATNKLKQHVGGRAVDFELWMAPSRLDVLRRALEPKSDRTVFEALDLANLDISLESKNDQDADLRARRAVRGDAAQRRVLHAFLYSRYLYDRATGQDLHSDVRVSDLLSEVLTLFGADFSN
jgi:hypothetical protein